MVGTCPPPPPPPAGVSGDGVMLSRVLVSAADSFGACSPMSRHCGFPCLMTATKVPSPSPVHDVEMGELDELAPPLAEGTELGDGPGLAPAPPVSCWLVCPSVSALEWNPVAQQLYASPVAVCSSLLSSPDSVRSTAK